MDMEIPTHSTKTCTWCIEHRGDPFGYWAKCPTVRIIMSLKKIGNTNGRGQVGGGKRKNPILPDRVLPPVIPPLVDGGGWSHEPGRTRSRSMKSIKRRGGQY